jgi:hypothetical protein
VVCDPNGSDIAVAAEPFVGCCIKGVCRNVHEF